MLSELGQTYRWDGQLEKARQNLEAALSASRRIGNRNDESQTLAQLAALAAGEKDFERAVSLINQALEISTALGNKGRQSFQWHDFASIEEQRNNLDTAKKARLSGLQIIETARESLGGLSDDKANYLENYLGYYHRYIGLLLRRGEVDEAFDWIEKTKARALLDLMQSGKVEIDFGASEAEKTRQAELRNAALSLNNQLVAETLQSFPNAQKLETLKSKLAEAEKELQEFTRTLYVAHPDLAAKRAANTATASEIAALLPPDTALLNYIYLGDSKFFVLCLTKAENGSQVQAYQIARPLDEIIELTDDFRDACASPDGKYKSKARELHKLLIAPAQAQLAGKTRLIICPDGALWGTPFGALMDEDKFLAEQYEVNYSYSATALQATLAVKNNPRRPGAPKTLLAFANPNFGGAERFQKQLEQANAERPLTAESRALSADSRSITRNGAILPLPGTQREADAIKADFPDAQIYLGQDAQEATAKTQAGDYRYWHLATHGLFNDAAPMLSSIVLAQPLPGSTEDGFLTAREIFDLNLKSDLVVLSACDTARGEKKNGEGVIGLTWALFVAGAPSQIVSQWAVNDSSTAELMKNFYANLKTGQSKGGALREAAHRLRSDKSHPYYWAPFILMGDWK